MSGAPKQNKNAQRGTEAATSHIHFRVMPFQKQEWQRKAESEGMRLTEWIISRLSASS
jgi:hypothetical protein